MDENEPRAVLERLIAEHDVDYARLSKLLGRNPAYIQQFLKRGSPKRLGEHERGILARYFGVDEARLGAPPSHRSSGSHLRLVPKLAVAASAGAGALTEVEAIAGQIGFDEKWLKKLGSDPACLSLIRVVGDSMAPTLQDGDDIMVDRAAANQRLRDGLFVIRMDDVLMVKRLTLARAGRISVLSDHPVYPSWSDVEGSDVTIIGRVIWAGRRL